MTSLRLTNQIVLMKNSNFGKRSNLEEKKREGKRERMATTVSLVPQFDDITAATAILCDGIESEFARFVGFQDGTLAKYRNCMAEITRLKSLSDASEIKMKHARSSFDYQLQKRTEAEDALKQYEKQFTIILELLSENKLNTLSAEERRSLAMLKRRSSCSPGRSFLDESSAVISENSIAPDMTLFDADSDVSILRDGKRWKRRRTNSTDKVVSRTSPPSKKRSLEEDTAQPDDDSPRAKKAKSSLSPVAEEELHKAPRLDSKFKKPPPSRNRRRPSKHHLKQLLAEETMEDELDTFATISPATLSFDEDSDPLPSAPPLDAIANHAPFTPPLSPRMYPELPASEFVDAMVPTTPTSGHVMGRSQSEINMERRHTFFTKSIIKTETCHVCQKKIGFKFGAKNCLKCKDCRLVCHPECKAKVPLPCIPCVPTPKKKSNNGSDLSAFCPQSIPRVPAILVHCVNEIEKRGLSQVGIYRVPGSVKAIREVKERLLRAKGTPNLEAVDDINVVCGVLKDFLQGLREPLLTFRMHTAFNNAADQESDEEGLAGTLEAIADLPPCNKDTLAFLILHLQKVAAHCDANKMPLLSLAKVFGPTVVGHGSANPSPSVMWADSQRHAKVMQRLLGIQGDYWRQYLSPLDNPEPPVSPSPSVQSSPGVLLHSPATPELRPVPESPFLGSCQSPKKMFSTKTPLAQRTASNVSSAPRPKRKFFAALN